LACKIEPQLKQIVGEGISFRFDFITDTGAPQLGHVPDIVYNDTHSWYPRLATNGKTNNNTKKELNKPRTNPPSGDAKNAMINARVTTPRTIPPMLFGPPPPPPPPDDGGKLYMFRRVEVDGRLLLLLFVER
jgi:hypothetical protein